MFRIILIILLLLILFFFLKHSRTNYCHNFIEENLNREKKWMKLYKQTQNPFYIHRIYRNNELFGNYFKPILGIYNGNLLSQKLKNLNESFLNNNDNLKANIQDISNFIPNTLSENYRGGIPEKDIENVKQEFLAAYNNYYDNYNDNFLKKVYKKWLC